MGENWVPNISNYVNQTDGIISLILRSKLKEKTCQAETVFFLKEFSHFLEIWKIDGKVDMKKVPLFDNLEDED